MRSAITLKQLSNLIFLIISCSLTVFTQDLSRLQKVDLTQNYKIEKEYLRGKGDFSVLQIYVLWKTTEFSKENLLNLIQKLKINTENSQNISITIFSSTEELKKQIEADIIPMPDFDDTIEGKKKRDEFFKKYYPNEIGYYRAFYIKNKSVEYIIYSPEKDSDQLLKITLKD